MRSSLEATLAHILAHEGERANDPQDPGGCTMRGITLATYRAHGHPRAGCAALRRMPESEARAIYTRSYWEAVRGDDLPAGVDLLVCDHGVNAGPGRAIRMLQGVVLVAQDGDLGVVSLAALERAALRSPAELIGRIAGAREAYYRKLKQFQRYGRGWLARVQAAHLAALRLMGAELRARQSATGGAR